MAAINNSILLISLPDIFRGLNVNPLEPSESNYLLWMLLGYMVVTATLLVTFGRLSDIFGRVRLYNAGFVVFTVASLLLLLTPSSGNAGALEIIVFRLLQGMGGGLLLANSAAILTDAFPANERGLALGLNMVATLAGSLIGLLVGGVLATIWWRAVFLVSVPIGIIVVVLSTSLPDAIQNGLLQNGVAPAVAAEVAHLPPTGALFAAFLGYNPMETLLPTQAVQALAPAAQSTVLGTSFFPSIIGVPSKRWKRNHCSQ